MNVNRYSFHTNESKTCIQTFCPEGGLERFIIYYISFHCLFYVIFFILLFIRLLVWLLLSHYDNLCFSLFFCLFVCLFVPPWSLKFLDSISTLIPSLEHIRWPVYLEISEFDTKVAPSDQRIFTDFRFQWESHRCEKTVNVCHSKPFGLCICPTSTA